MQKSLFRRIFALCAVVIVLSMFLLGMVFLTLATSYFRYEKLSSLNYSANQAANIISAGRLYDTSGFIDKRMLNIVINNMVDDDRENVLIFTDLDGVILASTTYDGKGMNDVEAIPVNYVEATFTSNEFSMMDTLGGVFETPFFTVGVCVYNTSNQPIGTIFASANSQTLTSLLKDYSKMFLSSAFVALVLASIVVYFVSASLVRPLREMERAASDFGKGNFSRRIDYNKDDEIGRLAKSLNEMADSLSTIDTMSRNFVGNVSHELRTPMTTISGFVDGILDGTIPKEEEEKYLNIVSQEVNRLTRTVKNMLNLAQIDSDKIHVHPEVFNLQDVLFEILFSFEDKINDKGINLEGLEIERIHALADKDMVYQVIYNLCENAVKFTPEKGYIKFEHYYQGDYVYFSISNSGKGISYDDLPHIFERFYKSDKSRSQDRTGVGLGLFIVKKLCNYNGGDIDVESVENEYTKFTFFLPMGEFKG